MQNNTKKTYNSKLINESNEHMHFLLYIIVCIIIYLNKMDKLSFISNKLKLILPIFILFSIITSKIVSKRININKLYLLWVMSAFGMLLSCINSVNMLISFKFLRDYSIALFIMIFFSISLKTTLKGVTLQKYICVVCMIFTIMPLVLKDTYFNLLNLLFSDSAIQDITIGVNSGRNSGILRFFGNDAFVLSVGLGIVIFILMENKNLIKNSILVLMFSLSILLTGSRAMFISSLASLFFILFLRNNNNIKKIFKTVIVIIFLITIMSLLITNFFPEALGIFSRFENGSESIYTRSILYGYSWQLFLNRPILGNGINTFLSLTYIEPSMIENTFVHNVILQLLAETGIVGTILIITPFFVTWGKTVRILHKKINCVSDKNIIKYLSISLYVQTIFLLYFITGNPIYDYNLLLIYFMFITIPININNRFMNNKL
ncbi:MAG TPA: O-antigen ligase family protein [Candidatus Paceibacterota bacterium]